jgi:DNA replication and repair protein RecF
MRLETVSASGFRNLNSSIELSSGLNILIGENGQGKTNWLEATSLLASMRSFRTGRLAEVVAFDGELAVVRGSVRESENIVRQLQASIGPTSKAFFINGKKEPPQRYLGQLHAIVFNADELEIIRGLPESRRRFLDTGIVGLHPPFVRVYTEYNRVIKQKNALLQKARDEGTPVGHLQDSLAPWNDQLKTLAARIHKARLRIVERLNEVINTGLFSRELLNVRYASSLEGKGDLGDYEALMAERLAIRLDAEIASGHCLIGPHRDDLDLTFDGRDIRKFGSAGQQRSALLLLQIASIEVYNATRGEYPLFLIDDIDAELDYRRIGLLLEHLEGKTQTLVTTSKESFIERFGPRGKRIDIIGGKASAAS